ncbi:uncharacterized protein J8A68_000473 [[Candida] subhashii]|uniref:Uncharacterized protein n=1 Tax=[Candida] subhashii TaxID=561895 RepID=A0A8J5QR78_9ASCO|nr:uncharacterized protein J8A68_000473 [[Candida] subhashii]KAG7666043.1 hypothetical protein J8A68_000473 [[Candida] subhashii]
MIYTIIPSRTPTGLDRFMNRFRKKGFWIYTGIILGSVGYILYEISRLPEIPAERTGRSKKKSTDTATVEVTEEVWTKSDCDKQIPRSSQSGAAKIDQDHDDNNTVKNDLPFQLLFLPFQLLLLLLLEEKEPHPTDAWTKRQLYEFLFNEKIYPDIHEDICIIKRQVRGIYDFKVSRREL